MAKQGRWGEQTASGLELNRTTEAKEDSLRAQLQLIPFSVTDVPHYCHCLKDATEQMERSRHPRSGPAGCNLEPVRHWTGDTIRCGRVLEPIGLWLALEQNELPVPVRYSEVEMVRVRGHSVPSG